MTHLFCPKCLNSLSLVVFQKYHFNLFPFFHGRYGSRTPAPSGVALRRKTVPATPREWYPAPSPSLRHRPRLHLASQGRRMASMASEGPCRHAQTMCQPQTWTSDTTPCCWLEQNILLDAISRKMSLFEGKHFSTKKTKVIELPNENQMCQKIWRQKAM